MKKTFDCIEMKRRGSAAVYEATKGMSLEEQLAFWREQTRILLEKRKQIRAKSKKKPSR